MMVHYKPVQIDYVFLDVEGFTSNRPTDAQAEIVEALNGAVHDAISWINDESRILIPTGDGVCVAMLDLSEFDAHVRVALSILANVNEHNQQEKRDNRRFQVRIGINSNHDVIVTDVNGRKNVAGSGINNASRIMGLADGGTVLVSDTVYQRLSSWEIYENRFRSYPEAEVKHGVKLKVHQLVMADALGLRNDPPKQLLPKLVPISREVAWYMGVTLKYKDRIGGAGNTTVGWMWLTAQEKLEEEKAARDGRQPGLILTQAERDSIDDHLRACMPGSYAWKDELTRLMHHFPLSPYEECFINIAGFLALPNEHGRDRLKREYPDIYEWALIPPKAVTPLADPIL